MPKASGCCRWNPGDRVAAAVVIAPEAEPNGNGGTLIQ